MILRAAATAIALFAMTPALAFEIGTMTDEERAIFRAEIRDYLLENPEVLMEAIAVLEERRAAEAVAMEDQLIEEHRAAIFDDDFSWVGGNPDGSITMVEFLDYRCGYCKRAHPEVTELIESDGDIRFVVKEFPILGEQSVLASQYAIAVKAVAGDEAYGEVHDAMMTYGGQISDDYLEGLSDQIGVDHGAVAAEMESDDTAAIIAQNRALGQLLLIQGTPTFILGDRFVRGYVDLDQMKAIVEEERAEG